MHVVAEAIHTLKNCLTSRQYISTRLVDSKVEIIRPEDCVTAEVHSLAIAPHLLSSLSKYIFLPTL
jgi:hypothetical protein